MRSSLTRLLRLCILLWLPTFACADTTAATPWLVESASGDVYARLIDNDGKGQAKPVVTGTLLPAPFEIITGEDGRARISRGADRIGISPNSIIEIAADTTDVNGLLTRAKQVLGSLLFEVEKRPDRGFEVETPFLVSVVKGTSFRVQVDRRTAAVALFTGRLQVLDSTRTQGVMIEPGQTAYFDPNDQQIHVQDSPQADANSERLTGIYGLIGDGDAGSSTVTGGIASIQDPIPSSLLNTTLDSASNALVGLGDAANSLTGTLDSGVQTTLGGVSGTVTGAGVGGNLQGAFGTIDNPVSGILPLPDLP